VNLLIGAVTIGLVLAPLALGVFVTYRIFHTLDLTTDGSFGVGAACVAALLVRGVPPLVATALGALAGAVAGMVTALLSRRWLVSPLLAGVLTTTAIYSVNLFVMGGGNLSLVSVDSVMTLADGLGRRLVGLPNSLTVLGAPLSGTSLASLVLVGLVAGGLALGLTLFLRTDLGLAVRAAGHNPQMATAVSIDVDRMVVLGFALANGLIALSGSLFAQFQGFANTQMGIGAIVTGVATLMVGEALLGGRTLGRWIAGGLAGAVTFHLLVAGAIRAGLNPNALKLVTAAFVLIVLMAPDLLRKVLGRRTAAEA
jgi:putative ABC transport system permease protein